MWLQTEITFAIQVQRPSNPDFAIEKKKGWLLCIQVNQECRRITHNVWVAILVTIKLLNVCIRRDVLFSWSWSTELGQRKFCGSGHFLLYSTPIYRSTTHEIQFFDVVFHKIKFTASCFKTYITNTHTWILIGRHQTIITLKGFPLKAVSDGSRWCHHDSSALMPH